MGAMLVQNALRLLLLRLVSRADEHNGVTLL
jgi:hypothetical protein